MPDRRCRCCGEVRWVGPAATVCPTCLEECTNEGCVISSLIPVDVVWPTPEAVQPFAATEAKG